MARAPKAAANTAPLMPAPDEPTLALYPVLSPLKHNGKRYRPDDPEPEARNVLLTEAEAEVLQAIGVIGEAAGPAEEGE